MKAESTLLGEKKNLFFHSSQTLFAPTIGRNFSLQFRGKTLHFSAYKRTRGILLQFVEMLAKTFAY